MAAFFFKEICEQEQSVCYSEKNIWIELPDFNNNFKTFL